MSMKIWTYGCSFTAGYNESFLSDEIWPNLLSIGEKYELVNRGHAGGGFHNVREYILQDIGRVGIEDLMIVQLPTSNRVCIPYFKTKWDSFMRIRHEHPKGTIGWIEYMKDFDGLVDTLGYEASILFDLLDRLELKWLWWSAEKASKSLGIYTKNRLSLSKYNTYEDWIWNNKKYWIDVDKGDWHQNKEGHIVQAKDFSKQIKKHLTRRRERGRLLL